MNPPLSHCQLGFRPNSPKHITLVPPADAAAALPARIPFYLRSLFPLMPRDYPPPAGWSSKYFRWPFDLEKGRLKPAEGKYLMQGELVRADTRWGKVWRGDFSSFNQKGHFQIESDYGCSYPIAIRDNIYERVQRSFLNYLYCQRSGFEIPGIRPAEHLDDGILDSTREQISAAGGWYDAGDLRKWMFLTQPTMVALAELAHKGHPGLRAAAVDEIRWGNKFFQAMMSPEGQIWEDLAGGTFKPGLDQEKDWWYENHPGCNCDNGGGVYTDNTPNTGDERLIRTTYNAAAQFMFVRTQCLVAAVLTRDEATNCRNLAMRAWKYGRTRGHDRRTLFVAEELWAALELNRCGMAGVDDAVVAALGEELLARQDTGSEGLHGYFLEKDGTDAFRCIALSCLPVMSLVRLVELAPAALGKLVERAKAAIAHYIDGYLLADAASNPFGIGPYGVYFKGPSADKQTFRDAGRGRGVRTFIHPFGPQGIVHGTGGVVLHQAALLAKAGRLLNRLDWHPASERMIQWILGHNPEGLSLHHGIGFRHPTPFSAWVLQLPDAISAGHVGRPDDTPYQETAPLIEWCTQEIWDIPNVHLTEAVLWL